MNKVFSKIAGLSVGLAMAIGVGVAFGGREAKIANATDVLYYQATFASADTEDSVSGYTTTWTTTHDSFAWSVSNFNNNNNGWDGYIKCGRKNNASLASISTVAAVADKVTKVSITIDALTASKINSITLYKGSSADSISTSLGTFVKGTGTKELTISSDNQATNQFYKIEFDCASGSSNGLLTLSNVSLYHEVSAVSPTAIACNPQSVSVVSTLNLADAVTFTPANTTEKGLSFSIKSGSEFIELSEDGVVTGKKGGAAVVTITPTDTSAGATAIDVAVTVNSIAAPALTIGDQYVIYAVDSANSGELSGVSNNLGTVSAMSGDVPACNYILTAESGYYENTVAFSDGTNYLSLNSAGNYLHTSNSVSSNSSWIVSSSDDVTHIINAAFPAREIRFNYNKGNARFACYNLDNLTAVSLYHYEEKALNDFTIETEIDVYVSATKSIEVTYDPADAADKELTWASANEGIATVDNEGVVTGVAVGEVIITASKTIGGNLVERTCTVHVLNNVSTHRGTAADPFNVEDAFNVAKGIFVKDPDGIDLSATGTYYVSGLLTKYVNRTKSKLTFWLGDVEGQDTADEGAFEIYQAGKVYGVNLADEYTADTEVVADFPVGAHVVAVGTFTVYNGTAETSNGTADIKYCEYVAARKFAEGFNAAFEAEGVCDADGKTTDVENLAGIWSNQGDAYDALDDATVAVIEGTTASSADNATAIAKCLAKYDYIGGKYQTQLGDEFDFMGRNPSPISGSAIQRFDISEDNNAMVIVISIVAISALAFTTLLVFKKKRQK